MRAQALTADGPLRWAALDDLHPDALALLREHPRLVELPREDERRCELLAIRNRVVVDDAWLDARPDLRALVKPGTGVDNIRCDLAGRGVRLFNSPGANANGVAELTLLLILEGLRDVFRAEMRVKQTYRFARANLVGRELRGRTVGLVGLGSIGRQVARYLAPFAVRVLGHDVRRLDSFAAEQAAAGVDFRWTSLDALLRESDVVSLHLPLLPTTDGMIGAAELARMKPGSVLVNTSRGGLVDCDALLAAIEGDVLGFYAADTIRDEAGMCEAERLLTEHPRVLLTPHIGAQTERSFAKMCTVAVENMLVALASPPPP